MTATIASARSEKSTIGRTGKRLPLSMRAVRSSMGFLSRHAPEGAAVIAERMFLTPRRRPRPEAETRMLAAGKPLTLTTKHGRLAAWEWEPDDAVASVLLVHGWEGRGAQLGALIEPLLASGLRVVTFDAPGHGDSPGTLSSLFHFAHAVRRAAEVLGPFRTIVTHSMGGPSTLWASRRRPLAESLVMVAPPIDLRDFTRVGAATLGVSEDVRERVHRRLGARFGVPIEEVRAERLASAMVGPLLIVHDEGDREVPIACGEAIARAWPDAKLVRTSGLGHQRILRDAKTIDLIAGFAAGARHE